MGDGGAERRLENPYEGLIEQLRLSKSRLGEAQSAELEMQRRRLTALAAWSHKNEGTPETHSHASRTRQGALARLHLSGAITADQLAWAVEIAMVAEMIERDVSIRVASLEARVDYSGSGRNSLYEGIMRVRRQVAYTHWRGWIPQPKRAVLDMLVGEPKPFSTVAREYRIHWRRTKRMLIEAIDLWPDAMKKAEEEVDDATLAAAYAAIL